MDIETKGLGAGSYPEPPENTIEKEIIIHLTIATNDNFSIKWDKDEIINYIKENLNDYEFNGDKEIEEIEVY